MNLINLHVMLFSLAPTFKQEKERTQKLLHVEFKFMFNSSKLLYKSSLIYCKFKLVQEFWIQETTYALNLLFKFVLHYMLWSIYNMAAMFRVRMNVVNFEGLKNSNEICRMLQLNIFFIIIRNSFYEINALKLKLLYPLF